MPSVECLREFVSKRLTAAAEEIFGVFVKTIVEYEEEIDRQRKLLDIAWKPEINLHRIELSQQHVCKEEEVLTDQQIFSQERNSSLDQEEPEPPQIKEEQEEVCTSQEGEQLVVKLETDEFMLTPAELECDQQLLSNNSHEAESQTQKGGEHEDSGSIRDAEAEPIIRHYENESDSNKTSMSEIQHDNLTGKKPFVCDTCGKCVRGKRALQVHVRIHTGEKPYSCNTCGKDFRTGSDLKVHMRSHTGEKPYLCKFCGKSFGYRSTLMVHVRIHTGEKPFSCNTCGERFLDVTRLKTHMAVHTGKKPYSCEICGKNFQYGNVLKVHMRSHTGERPFTCKTCGKGFSQSCNLKAHMRTHTGERPYLCIICGKRFLDASNFAKHKRSHKVSSLTFANHVGDDSVVVDHDQNTELTEVRTHIIAAPEEKVLFE